MRSRAGVIVLVGAICSPWLGSAAYADQIRIISGGISYSRQNLAEVNLVIESPFTNNIGWIRGDFGANESWVPQHACFQCVPGGTINPSVSESFDNRTSTNPDVGVGGSFFLDGSEYAIQILNFTIDAESLRIPDNLDSAFTSAAPFIMRGLISGPALSGPTSGRGFTFFGVGNASVVFEGGNWFQTTYTFADPAAVPEPGTMLLFGSGAAALAARRRRQRA